MLQIERGGEAHRPAGLFRSALHPGRHDAAILFHAWNPEDEGIATALVVVASRNVELLRRAGPVQQIMTHGTCHAPLCVAVEAAEDFGGWIPKHAEHKVGRHPVGGLGWIMADRHLIPVQPVAGAYEHGVILSGLQVVEEAFPLMEERLHIGKRMR